MLTLRYELTLDECVTLKPQIEALDKAYASLTGAQRATAATDTTAEKSAKKTRKKATSAKTKKDAKPADETPAVTLEDLKLAMSKYVVQNSVEDAREILSRYKTKNLGSLDEKHWPAMLKELST